MSGSGVSFSHSFAEHGTQRCAECREALAGQRKLWCSRCKLVIFCGNDCQLAYWSRHKQGCNSVKKQRKCGAPPADTLPLMHAAQNGDDALILALVEAGADINAARPSDGATALLLAVDSGQFTSACELLRLHADPSAGASRHKGWAWSPHESECPCAACPTSILTSAPRTTALMAALRNTNGQHDRGDKLVRALWYSGAWKHEDEDMQEELQRMCYLYLTDAEMDHVKTIMDNDGEGDGSDEAARSLDATAQELMGYSPLSIARGCVHADSDSEDDWESTVEQSIMNAVRERNPAWRGTGDNSKDFLTAMTAQMFWKLAHDPEDVLNKLSTAGASSASRAHHMVTAQKVVADFFTIRVESLSLTSAVRRARACMVALGSLRIAGAEPPSPEQIAELAEALDLDGAESAREVVEHLRKYVAQLESKCLDLPVPTGDSVLDALRSRIFVMMRVHHLDEDMAKQMLAVVNAIHTMDDAEVILRNLSAAAAEVDGCDDEMREM